jgi:hypothetical protein
MSLPWRICFPMAAAIALCACSSQPQAASGSAAAGAANGSAEPQKEFVVTPELYNKTFDEVNRVIAELTSLINAQDFEGWRSFLTADYIARTSDPEFLRKASSSGVLQKNGIVLHSLKDYFENVVVRSRTQATLTDINFVDKTHVKAMTVVDGNPVILYYLVQEDGRWKVGIWSTEKQ